jgi:sec-independent protein translocase protein TatA
MPCWAVARFRRSWLFHLPFFERERPMFGIGQWELIIILVVIFLLFGNRLPSVMRSLGRGVVEFKEGMAGTDKDEPGKEEKKEV